MRATCGDCVNIGERTWGLPDNERSCKRIKQRQNDFDAVSARIECVDAFRFRPTQGVLPYSEAGHCKYFEAK